MVTHHVKRSPYVTIGFFDVDYRDAGARAACVLAQSWGDAMPTSEHACDIDSVEAYEPGSFYKRELPCLLSVLNRLPEPPDIAVVDGYVWLDGEERPGLGFHLFKALGSKMPVVGIAKTAFVGAEASLHVGKVYRGQSRKPLFVTSVGVELAIASAWVKGMAGPHRIPSLLTAVDRLARLRASAVQNDA